MEIRADRLLGRQVLALNGRPIGRIEEFHLRKDGRGWIVSGFALGPAGLLERLGVHARALLGLKNSGYVLNWDQVTVSEAGPVRLTCPVRDLRSA